MPQRELIVRGPTYFSAGDEKAFFDWLQSIPCVGDIGGRYRNLHITLKRQPTDLQLRELIALLYRYKINMKQLEKFKTKRNAKWFASNPDAYWHWRIFGRSKTKKTG